MVKATRHVAPRAPSRYIIYIYSVSIPISIIHKYIHMSAHVYTFLCPAAKPQVRANHVEERAAQL